MRVIKNSNKKQNILNYENKKKNLNRLDWAYSKREVNKLKDGIVCFHPNAIQKDKSFKIYNKQLKIKNNLRGYNVSL